MSAIDRIFVKSNLCINLDCVVFKLKDINISGNIITFKNDKKNGTSITWDKSGAKISESLFQDGLDHGPYSEWFGNGNKKEEGTYYKGKKQGRVNFYNRDGKKLYFQTYKDGKLIIE